MKVGFYVQAYEHIGVEILAAVLKKAGHTVELFFDPRLCADGVVFVDGLAHLFRVEDKLIEEMLHADLDLLCFSTVTDNYSSSLRVARKMKSFRPIRTVFGGVHCTSVPERVAARPEVDYVVVGEGEYPLVELCEVLANGGRDFIIPNVWYKGRDGDVAFGPTRPTITNLDELPFLDKDVFFDKVPAFHRKRYTTVASRGCVYACTFCNNSMYKNIYNKAGNGRWQRRRSVDNLMDELRQAHAKYRFKYIMFWDEIFIDNREWLEEFCDKYGREIGKPYWCYGYAKFIDKSVIEMLEKSGCREINIGVQTIREYTKRHYLKRGEKQDKLIEAINLIRDSGIYLSTGNILDIPGQSIEEGLELAEFYNENRVDLPLVGFLRYYPRTEIVDIALKEGILTAEDVEQIDEAEEERPFFKTTSKDSPEFKQVRALIKLTPFAPPSLVPWLIRTGFWRYLPGDGNSGLVLEWMGALRGLWTRKLHMAENYTAGRYLYLLSLYGCDKLKWLVKKGFSGHGNLPSGAPKADNA